MKQILACANMFFDTRTNSVCTSAHRAISVISWIEELSFLGGGGSGCLLRHRQVSLHFSSSGNQCGSLSLYVCSSNHCDSLTLRHKTPLSLSARQNPSCADWCLKLERGRKQTRPACHVLKEITHLRVIVGRTGPAEAHINHNKDAYWSSVRSTRVMMSERTEGAGR